MKSCIMAAWLLTVSFGNLLVVILAGVKLTEDMVRKFLICIALNSSEAYFALYRWGDWWSFIWAEKG